MTAPFFARGGGWVLGQSVLVLAVIVLAAAFHDHGHRLAVIIPGLVLLAVGGVFGIAGAIALKTNLTPFPKPRPESRLIQSGIYSRVRHPLYTSVILASLGWALLWQSWPALLAAFALGPFFNAKARREERWLREMFPDYASYEKRVKRFLPWIY